MKGKTFALRIYTLFLIIIFLGIIIPDLFNPECFSNTGEILQILIISFIAITLFIIFLLKPERWELFCLLHIVFCVWITVQTSFPSKYMISALLYTESVVIAFAHGFYAHKGRIKMILTTLGLFLIPLFEPGFTAKVLLRAEFLNAYIFGIAIFSFLLIRFYFLEHIIKEGHILLSKRQVLDLGSLGLNKKEIELMNFILKGITYKEIAELYKISESSVKKYMKMLFSKFGVNSKEEFLSYISQFELTFPNDDK